MKQQQNRNSSPEQVVVRETRNIESTGAEKPVLTRNQNNTKTNLKHCEGGLSKANNRVLQEVIPYHQPIKYDKLYYDILDWDSDSESDSDFDEEKSTKSSNSGGNAISFNNYVSVVPIPDRNHYDESVRARIWSNIDEISENAQRNALEFDSEGWDWRKVAQDHEMITCSESGELVHPVHYKKPHVTS